MSARKVPTVKIDLERGATNHNSASRATRSCSHARPWKRLSRLQIIVGIVVCATMAVGALGFALTLKLLHDSGATAGDPGMGP